MNIRPMTLQDRKEVLAMETMLYHSPAVEAPIPPQIMERSFADAVGENPHIQGFFMEENGKAAGFAYLTFFYSCEIGGDVVMVEELFIKEEFRGCGLGQQFFDWLYGQYPDIRRFRLDITFENRAARLYERNGFRYPDYRSMIFDR